MKFNKKNTPLIIGLAIPVLMIIFVAASIYLPSLWMKPTQDFIYISGRDYYSVPRFEVKNSKLTVSCESPYAPYKGEAAPAIIAPESSTTPCKPEDAGTLYLHDVEADASRTITYEDAQKLTLDISPQSSEGYEVVGGDPSGDVFSMLFGGRSYDYRARYLKKGSLSKKLNVRSVSGSGYSFNDFRFLGWVE